MLFAITPLTCPVVEMTPVLGKGEDTIPETVVGNCQIFERFGAGFSGPNHGNVMIGEEVSVECESINTNRFFV